MDVGARYNRLVIDWAELVASDFPVPASIGPVLAELSTMLAAADPGVRDEGACTILVNWVRRGVLDDHLADLGATMVSRLAHPEGQARTFAPLLLAAVVDRDTIAGVLNEERLLGFRDAFVPWWLAELDIRGWDEQRGWLHAIANGADLAGALGTSPRLTAGDVADLLTVVARRVVTPT